MTISTDNFNRADAATLGASWTALTTDVPRISGNKAMGKVATTGVEEEVIYGVDCGSPDMYAQIDATFVQDYGNFALEARATDYNNRYYVYINQTNLSAQLVRWKAGVYTQLRAGTNAEVTWAITTTRTFRLETEGTGASVTIRLKNNGVTVFTYVDSSVDRLLTGQKGGFGFSYVGSDAAFSADNYEQGKLIEAGGAVDLSAAIATTSARPLTITTGGVTRTLVNAAVTVTAQALTVATAAPNVTLIPAIVTVTAQALIPPTPPPPPIVIPPPVVEPVESHPLIGPAWHLYVINELGQRVAELDDYTDATIVPRFNRVGSWALTTAATPAAQLLNRDRYGIEAVKATTVVLTGPVTSRERVFEPTPDGFFDGYRFAGVDDLHHVARALASPQPAAAGPPYSTSAHDVRSGLAGQVIAEYVDVNVGPSAVAARRVPGLTVAPVIGVGTVVTGRARWQNLLELAQELATAGGVGFRMTRRVFERYAPQDRSSVVKFSVALGNLATFTYTEQVPAVNHAVVAGGGELTARIIIEAEDTASVARWGRIEQFVDRRDTVDLVELGQAAQEALQEGAVQHGFSLGVLDGTGRSEYLQHYQLGDRVAVIIDGVEVVDVVHEVKITLTDAGVRMVPSIGDPEADPKRPRVYDVVRRHDQRLRNLERR